jgi:hypothetical protein
MNQSNPRGKMNELVEIIDKDKLGRIKNNLKVRRQTGRPTLRAAAELRRSKKRTPV